jgi:hypothetical protein
MRDDKQPDPFDNPFCAAAGFAADPHEVWRQYTAQRRPQKDYNPFEQCWKTVPLPPEP